MRGVHISISVTIISIISIILAAALLGLSIAAFNMPAAQAATTTGTLIINSTTVLTEDHDGNIIIAADGITLDGNGHSVTGNNSGIGVSLANRSDVTIKNLKVKNFTTGISLTYSDNNTLTHNTISNNSAGIGLSRSGGITIANNVVSNNIEGIGLYYSDCDLTDNTVSNNGGGISLNQSGCGFTSNTVSNNNGTGVSLFRSDGIFTGNIVSNNGERGISLNQSPSTLTNNIVTNNYDGIYLLYYCNECTFTGNTISNNRHDGIVIWGGSGSTLLNNTFIHNNERGIWLHMSSLNVLTGNTILNNTDGILLENSSNNNTLTGNKVSNNNGTGIDINGSYENTLIGNNISNNGDGIGINAASSSIVTGNFFSMNNNCAINLSGFASNNSFTGNTISNNNCGIKLHPSSNNKVYHNNFINNPTQALVDLIDISHGNVFNLPAPIGGNYWDNYDIPAEGCVDTSPADGFCDSPYIFTGGNDSLPWTSMNGWLKPAVITLTFQGYDYDNKGEVSILVNNQEVDVLPTRYSPENNNLFTTYALDISNYVVAGSNSLTFQQNMYSSGVRNVAIKSSSTTIYSNSTYYSIWVGGRESVTYSFSTSPVILAFQGYDYNNKGEVSILVNNQLAYTLPASYSPQNSKTYASYTLDISKYIHAGSSNTVTFRQNIYSSAVKEVHITQLGSTIYSNSTHYSIWEGGRESVTYTFNVP